MGDVEKRKKSRSSALGNITKALTNISGLMKTDLADLDHLVLQRHNNHLDRSFKTFSEHNAELLVIDDDFDEDKHMDLEDEQLDRVQKGRRISETITHAISLRPVANKLVVLLQDLKSALSRGYQPGLAPQYEEIEGEMPQFKHLYSQSGVEDVKGIAALRGTIMTMWTDAIGERNATGYDPRASTRTVTATPTTTSSEPKVVGLSAKLPKFSGKDTEFQDFKRLFLSIMSSQTQLNDDSKNSLLLECMVTKDNKEQARRAIKENPVFLDAVKSFSSLHENGREVAAHHWQEILRMPVLDQNYNDVQSAIKYLADDAVGIRMAGCLTADQLIVSYMDSRFGPALQVAWRTHTQGIEGLPTAADLRAFLNKQASIVAKCVISQPQHSHPPRQPKRRSSPKRAASPARSERARSPSPPTRSVFQAHKQRSCAYCQGDHTPFSCSKFKEKSPQQRRESMRSARRCFNCLGEKHTYEECRSPRRCQECQKKHHTLLHLSTQASSSKSSDSADANACRVTTIGTSAAHPVTALVEVSAGSHRLCARVMVDTGAEISLISQTFANALNAPHLRLPPMTLSGMGSQKSPYAVRLTMYGEEHMGQEKNCLRLQARVVEEIPQPTSRVVRPDLCAMPFLQDCELSDPDYKPGDAVDIILDSDTWYVCRTGGVREADVKGLMADSTIFGWVVGGPNYAQTVKNHEASRICRVSAVEQELDDLVDQLGMSPDVPEEASARTVQEERAEEVFQQTYTRLPDDRRQAGMLVMDDPPRLGESRSQALSRFNSVRRSMTRKGTWPAYCDAVRDFIQAGHAEEVSEEELDKPDAETYYMPMHAVQKVNSTTTKVRPVCDASAITSTGVSYNDTLLTGPSLYPSLSSILLRFRDPAIAMTADVSKMFRQISLSPKDRDFHRFFFLNAEGVLTVYRMTRVTFGVKSSPFVATRMIQQLAAEQRESFPEAAEVIFSSFYVDDVLTGAQTLAQAQQLRIDLNKILESGKMPLVKWRSNSQALLDSIPADLRELSDLKLSSSPASNPKTLGVHWATLLDDLFVSTPTVPPSQATTKRQLISVVAQVYDPLGWFAPTIMVPRIMAQQTWKDKIGWDQQLSQSLLLTWQGWLEEMPVITKQPISRHYGDADEVREYREIHGFSDASEDGYGGVVYLRSVYPSGKVVIDLLTAKGKVAPIKKLTIPRLELKGAVVLTQLMKTVVQELHIDIDAVYGWTDSTIVLAWLTHQPHSLTVFAGNRVKQIHSTLPSIRWNHVPGIQNPADCLSRGLRPTDLCKHQLWWKGPSWLSLSSNNWPSPEVADEASLPEMRRKVGVSHAETATDLSLNQRSFTQWVRIVSWIRRFWYNIRHRSQSNRETFLHSIELSQARKSVFRASQRLYFADELRLLQQGKTVSKKHILYRLSPFVDHDGLLKAKGRLEQSSLPDEAKHPIILSPSSHVVKMFVLFMHRKMLHPPMSAAMASISYNFHIPRLKPLLKSICHNCVHCQRKWARPLRQRMGDLPAIRTEQSSVFRNVGVDYAGPLFLYYGRGIKKVKAYVAIFVCMSTRAVHLELAADATTKSFLAVLDRFCGRRGTPYRIYSDNGGNFRGAAAELRDVLSQLSTTSAMGAISAWGAERGMKWIFQPAVSPHRGGLWEAGVRVMKSLIRRQLHQLHLRMDEVNTLLISAEAVMNSRPYLPLHTTDPDALCPLTPGHFLVGRPLCSLPQRVDLDSRVDHLRHWDLVKRLEHHNWTQFVKIFLPQLRSRALEMTSQENLKVDDVVLLTNHHTRRNEWPLGIVVAVFPGPDGLVRSADVKVETSGTTDARLRTTVMRRAVQGLVKMPIEVP